MSRWTDLLKAAAARNGGRVDWPLDAVPAARDLAPGMIVGEQYLIEAVLGEGGFGRVFRCANWQGQLCAVKTLRPDRARDPATVAMMRAEVQRWVELGVHPHLVTAFGMMEHARLPCVVMEYLDGARDLAAIIARGGAHWTTALNAGAQVAAALEHAHARSGLIHRDIKPENILVIGNDWAKLSDFGISVASRTEPDSLGHLRIGTAPYMAPELWGERPRYGMQSDLYALAVTLCEAATGRHPLADGGRHGFEAYGRMHLSATPRSPLRDDPTIPPASPRSCCNAWTRIRRGGPPTPPRRVSGWSRWLA
jgi:serine/threonine protein kinase